MHPWASEEYRESARGLRKIAFECIEKRLRDLKSGVTYSQDILTFVLGLTGSDSILSYHCDCFSWLLNYSF